MIHDLIIQIVVLLFVLIWTALRVNESTRAKMDELSWYIEKAVRCAEQIYTPEQWREKKQYVMDMVINYVNDKLHVPLSEADIDMIVEGVVNEIKKN